MKRLAHKKRVLLALVVVVVGVLVPTAAQADSKFYESPIFGIANGPDGSLFAADGGQGSSTWTPAEPRRSYRA